MKNRIGELNQLLKIKKQSDIKSLNIIEFFTNDNLQCADVKINGIPITFSFYDELGFLYYYKDSKKAFKHLTSAIKNSVQIEKDME